MHRGLDFAVGQLANGVAHFKKVFADDCSESLETLLEEMTKEDDGSGDEDGEYLDEVQQEEEDAEGEESEDEGNFMDYVRRSCPHSELDCYRTVMWKYPEEFRQGSVDGRSGSNACSVIALVIAYNFVREGLSLPVDGVISPFWSVVLYQAMRTGNNVYDRFRATLPSRFLSAAEACDILSGSHKIELGHPLPVRLEDEHHHTTISSQLNVLAIAGTTKLAVLVMSGKTSLFIVRYPDVLFVDTHFHLPNNGVVVLRGLCDRLDSFCRSVWAVQEFDNSTFGNLVPVISIS